MIINAYSISKYLKPNFIISQCQRHSFVHSEVYPDDDYNHILGMNDDDHTLSKLQEITALRIKDVKLSKTPIDTV